MILQQLASFEVIQISLTKPITPAYHDPDKILWINLNILKEFGFGVIIIYTDEENELIKSI